MTNAEKLVADIEDASKEIEQRMEENPELDLMSVAISLWIRASDEKDRVVVLRAALESALKTAKFENHPFRGWHGQAEEALVKCK